MMHKEVCRMLIVYFEVPHIDRCLLALGVTNDSCGSLLINEQITDDKVHLSRCLWSVFSSAGGQQLTMPLIISTASSAFSAE